MGVVGALEWAFPAPPQGIGRFPLAEWWIFATRSSTMLNRQLVLGKCIAPRRVVSNRPLRSGRGGHVDSPAGRMRSGQGVNLFHRRSIKALHVTVEGTVAV